MTPNIFGNADTLPTAVILERLTGGEDFGLDADAPWADLHGKPLNERGLASLLRKYEIHPVKVKALGKALQGYRRDSLHDAWQRYLPSVSQQTEPAEPTDPAAGKVPEVPEVPDYSAGEGLVQCRPCKFFEGEDGASNCLKFDRPVDPEHLRDCPAFGLPIILA